MSGAFSTRVPILFAAVLPLLSAFCRAGPVQSDPSLSKRIDFPILQCSKSPINDLSQTVVFNPFTFHGDSWADFCDGGDAECYCTRSSEVFCIGTVPTDLQKSYCPSHCTCIKKKPLPGADEPPSCDASAVSIDSTEDAPSCPVDVNQTSGNMPSCTAICTSMADCSVSCSCAVASAIDPGNGSPVLYSSTCIESSKKALHKRVVDGYETIIEARGCVCNSTYISDACCDTLDGLVHEPPENELFPLNYKMI